MATLRTSHSSTGTSVSMAGARAGCGLLVELSFSFLAGVVVNVSVSNPHVPQHRVHSPPTIFANFLPRIFPIRNGENKH